ncbi:putative LRR receptor-like serine/threonine-protein kinase [Hibiscus syriacus]|uniref:LRR receptor-like serine/threonine-protein kinase n=1 Tax=Hibiscus syriacus TaxID=106335 RepID=A0A6A2XIY5_HIBSY|nr:putative LRR receptor-like serine/threonine-protein kinase [Hibiscus syriacus]
MALHVMWIALLLFRWVHSLPAGDSLLSPKGVNYEVTALMLVKREMKDDRNVMDSWDINSVDPCTWNMVACSAEGYVISLEMASKGLSGVLSPSIVNLSHLRTIAMGDIFFAELGASIGSQSLVFVLLLQNNKLSGPIPDEIGKLPELQTLDLSGNEFVGLIPRSLGSLTHLTYLRLSNNNLTGPIPGTIANLTGLSFLDVSFNNLSGPTPKNPSKSISGNDFLCTSSYEQSCTGVLKPLNGSVSSSRASGYHRRVLSVAIAISSVFVVSLVLLVVQHDYDLDIDHVKRSFIAVKRLRDPNFTGEVQFQTEVEMIGLALHRNLLRYACREKPSLNWNRRMHIALGAARGLLYLHEHLLDKKESHVTTAVRGTVGHIAPEYLSTGQSSEKTDVFGFGILLLELITGQKTLDAGNGQVQKGMILDWVRTLQEEERLEVLVDRDLRGCFDPIELEKTAELALQCTQSQPHLRPKMSEVLKVLEGLVQSGTEESQVGQTFLRLGSGASPGIIVTFMKSLPSSLKQWSFPDLGDRSTNCPIPIRL